MYFDIMSYNNKIRQHYEILNIKISQNKQIIIISYQVKLRYKVRHQKNQHLDIEIKTFIQNNIVKPLNDEILSEKL